MQTKVLLLHQNGFSLLEVLIALTIFSIGLLGISNAEIKALRAEQEAYLHSLAVNQIHNLLEQLPLCIQSDNCDAIISHWQSTLKKLLPGGSAEVRREGLLFIVTLHWRSRLLLSGMSNLCVRAII